MNSFLIFGVIFIPLYITYNWICFNKKSVSIWIGSEKVKVLDDTYFKYQFKGSIITCLVMLVFIITATVLQISDRTLPLLAILFWIVVSVIKYLAVRKDNDLKGICVVTKQDDRTYELKNIAIYKAFHGQGYGRKLVEYIFEYFKDDGDTMYVGTGDSPLTLPFYEKCGFKESHRVKDFFIENYDNPIYECKKQLIDMVYLKKYRAK